MISKKVILTGNFGVGKTSLFNRFVYDRFSDKYLTTIGVKVNKKVLEINGEELSILLWDIAGEVSQDKVPVSYFLGAAGIIYVFDLSRPITFQHIEKDLNYLKELLPDSIVKIVGNKNDLVSKEEVAKILSELNVACNITTSAKTGERVEDLFSELGVELLEA
ncbi:MAG: small GTP-binding protein [Maribacter sp.]|jgi:small GTP-binding protein